MLRGKWRVLLHWFRSRGLGVNIMISRRAHYHSDDTASWQWPERGTNKRQGRSLRSCETETKHVHCIGAPQWGLPAPPPHYSHFFVLNGAEHNTDWKKWIQQQDFCAVDIRIDEKPKWPPSAWFGQTNFFSMGDKPKILFSTIWFSYPSISKNNFHGQGGSKWLLGGLLGHFRAKKGYFQPISMFSAFLNLFLLQKHYRSSWKTLKRKFALKKLKKNVQKLWKLQFLTKSKVFFILKLLVNSKLLALEGSTMA